MRFRAQAGLAIYSCRRSDPGGVVHCRRKDTVLLVDDWLRAEAAAWGLPDALAPALCLAQTAVYRRFGSQIACHLWLEMLRLQESLRSTRGRLRRLMVAQLDSTPPPEYPLEAPF